MNNAERQTRYRKRRMEVGGCIDCSQPAIPGKVRCNKHLLNNYVRVKQYTLKNPGLRAYKQARLRELHKLEGKCTRCAVELDVYADAGYTKCLNCRETA